VSADGVRVDEGAHLIAVGRHALTSRGDKE